MVLGDNNFSIDLAEEPKVEEVEEVVAEAPAVEEAPAAEAAEEIQG